MDLRGAATPWAVSRYASSQASRLKKYLRENALAASSRPPSARLISSSRSAYVSALRSSCWFLIPERPLIVSG